MWTFTNCLEKWISSFELRCFRRVLGITWKQKITSIEVKKNIERQIGTYEPFLETRRKRKLQWFGHVEKTDRNFSIRQNARCGGREERKRGANKFVVGRHHGMDKEECRNLCQTSKGQRWMERIVKSSKYPYGQWLRGVTCMTWLGDIPKENWGWKKFHLDQYSLGTIKQSTLKHKIRAIILIPTYKNSQNN